MEELDGNLAVLKQHEKAQDLEDEAYSILLAEVDPIIDEMNILLGQILDLSDQGDYNFEEEISELISTELGL